MLALIVIIILLFKLFGPLSRIWSAGLDCAEAVLTETAEKLEQKRGTTK